MKRISLILLRRGAHAFPVMLGVVVVVFFLLKLAPGDLVEVMAAEGQINDLELLARMRAQFGLDQPVYIQFANYAWNVLRFDLGYSARDQLPVRELIASRVPATLVLMLASVLLALVVGVGLGMFAALRVNTLADNIVSAVMILFFAAPGFWVGLMLMVVFSVKLGWFPVSGFATIGLEPGTLRYYADIARHLVLPALALGLFYAAVYARVMRSSMLEVHGMDFVTTARSKGQTERRIAFAHVMRNALLPIVTLFGLQLGTVFAGSVVIENVFSWPGTGTLLFDSVQARNMPVIAGVLLLGSLVVVLSNLFVDLIYLWLDPRIEP